MMQLHDASALRIFQETERRTMRKGDEGHSTRKGNEMDAGRTCLPYSQRPERIFEVHAVKPEAIANGSEKCTPK
jgi:hypothetical protein